MNLKELFEKVGDAWRFDTKNYPRLHLSIGGRVDSTAHVLLHISKTAGKLATIFEQLAHMEQAQGSDATILDHPVTKPHIARQTAYMVVNVVKLAALAGVTPEEVAAEIQLWAVEQEKSA